MVQKNRPWFDYVTEIKQHPRFQEGKKRKEMEEPVYHLTLQWSCDRGPAPGLPLLRKPLSLFYAGLDVFTPSGSIRWRTQTARCVFKWAEGPSSSPPVRLCSQWRPIHSHRQTVVPFTLTHTGPVALDYRRDETIRGQVCESVALGGRKTTTTRPSLT